MDKEAFLRAVDTLKLYRRAELLNEEGQRLIETLYVDPLPNDHVLRTILQPNSTFVIGRKGTGKSTLFQRAQETLNRKSDSTWAYIDIKTLYESSVAELMAADISKFDHAIPQHILSGMLAFKTFTQELVKEIKRQVNERITSSVWESFKERFTGSKAELFQNLDEFIRDLERADYTDVTRAIQLEAAEKETQAASERKAAKASLMVGTDSSVSGSGGISRSTNSEIEHNISYSKVLIRVLKIRDLIRRLCEILKSLSIRHLYIFIDDFSELPQTDMERVLDAILAPFNNWSEEFIKLKIAVYPGRIVFGQIDRSKVDEVYLDIYRAYGRNDLPGMEDKAVDFTRRLIEKRFSHFHKGDIADYLETENPEFWTTLFNASLGNPRILGYVLFFAYETNIIYGKRIGVRTIQDAARRYYEEKISNTFRLNKFLNESFAERSSIFSLRELIEQVVRRAKDLRNYRGSAIMEGLSGRAPTSHFHIHSAYDSVLLTLELNFFITKYYEMKDRDGREVSVYALNYGLCQQQAITFGRPKGKREYRLYFVERMFDYSPIIQSYIRVNQEIVCESCGAKHDHDQLPAIQAFDMLCPRCKRGVCRIVNLSRKYEELINAVSKDNLLPDTDLGILKTLHDARRDMFARDIAEELDCSYQLIGKRGRRLADRQLVERQENENGRRIFKISGTAEHIYFQPVLGDEMSFENEEGH